MMKDEDLDRLYDSVIQERSPESIVRLAAALAEQTPGESTLAEDRLTIERLFNDQISELTQKGDTNQSSAEEFMEDKLYELRQWLCFLRYTYLGAKASSETALELSRAKESVKRIHSLRLEQAARGTRISTNIRGIRRLLDTTGPLIIALNKSGAEGSLDLSRSAYVMARRGLRRVYLRSFGRVLKRRAFLLVAGFFFASYLLGMLPEMARASGSAITNGVLAPLVAFGCWAVDKWVLSPPDRSSACKIASGTLKGKSRRPFGCFSLGACVSCFFVVCTPGNDQLVKRWI
jgi:hypothetical protein